MSREMSYRPLYLAAVAAWFGLFVVPFTQELFRVRTANAASARRTLERVAVPFQELEQKFQRLQQLGEKVGSQPEEYFNFLEEVHVLRAEMVVAEGAQPPERVLPFRRMQVRLYGLDSPIEKVHQGYREKFGDVMLGATSRRVVPQMEKRVRARSPKVPDIPAAPTGHLWRGLYLASLPFAAFVLFLRLMQCGFSVVAELLVRPHYIAGAVFAWPIGLLLYPSGDPAAQIVRVALAVRRFAALAASSALSLFGAVAARAAEKPTDSDTKTRNTWTLQLDGRITGPLGDNDAKPLGFLRATITNPAGMLLETFSTVRDGLKTNSTVLGKSVVRREGLTVNVVAGGFADTAYTKGLQTGIQVYLNKRHIRFLMPACSWERQTAPRPVSTFVTGGWLLWPWKMFSVGGEWSFRKPQEKPTAWTLGPALQMKIGRASFVEVTARRNQDGAWAGRLRLAHTFAW